MFNQRKTDTRRCCEQPKVPEELNSKRLLRLAILFVYRRKSAGVLPAAKTVFSTGRRDRRIKSLIFDMSACISSLRCRDSEFHFDRLLGAGTHYLRNFLQAPSLTS